MLGGKQMALSPCEVQLSAAPEGEEVPEVGAHQVAGAVAFCSSDLPSGEFSVVENANP